MLSLEAEVSRAWPAGRWRDVTVLVAVSGGADSVALLRALVRLSRAEGAGRLIVAHYNHRLRGAESDGDASWVAGLCGTLELECEVGSPDAPLAGAGGEGLEAAARAARYEFLQSAAARRGARYVATAHTADDQAETILHRILRGTGLAGLAGIPRVRAMDQQVSLVRPMLEIRRQEVLAYLAALGQQYRIDSSNSEGRQTRNRLRNELLPQLARDYNPRIVEALVRLGRLAAGAQGVLIPLVEAVMERAVRQGPAGLTIDCARLGREDGFLAREVLLAAWRRQGWGEQAMGFVEWQRLAELAAGAPREEAITLPGGVRAHRKGEELVVTSRPVDG